MVNPPPAGPFAQLRTRRGFIGSAGFAVVGAGLLALGWPNDASAKPAPLSRKFSPRFAHADDILTAFEGEGTDVCLYSDPSGDYVLAQNIGNHLYFCWDFHSATATGSNGAILCMYKSYIRFGCAGVAVGDAAVTKSGTWTNGSSYSYYGNAYKYSINSGDYCEYTTPTGVTGLYLHAGHSNGGLVKILIDGDATRANLVTTAQQLVDGGISNTILVANGGTLNPTDRVINEAAFAVGALISLAEDLTAGSHTVRLVATGYASSSTNRGYCSGFGWITASTIATDSGFSIRKIIADITNTQSSNEHAFNITPTEFTGAQFVGNWHGYEHQTAVAFYVDGSPITPTAGGLYAGTVSADIVRTTELTHPSCTPTVLANIVNTYKMDPTAGLKLQHDITWQQTVYGQTFYIAMWQKDYSQDRYGHSGYVGDSLTALNYGGFTGWSWQSAGHIGTLLYLPDLTLFNSWADCEAYKLYTAGKDYVALKSSNGVTYYTIAASTNWEIEIQYRAGYWDSANTILEYVPATETFTPTVTETSTATSTATETSTSTVTETSTPTITDTPVNTSTATATVTNTATETSTPTITETPHITHTPNSEMSIPLSSGDTLVIERRVTYGDIFSTLAMLGNIALIGAIVLYKWGKSWLR